MPYQTQFFIIFQNPCHFHIFTNIGRAGPVGLSSSTVSNFIGGIFGGIVAATFGKVSKSIKISIVHCQGLNLTISTRVGALKTS